TLRGDEASARARGRWSRGNASAGPGETPLPESGPDQVDARPLDRQVHRASRKCPRGAQDDTRRGEERMTTTTAQTTQVYEVFIKASPEQIWEAITKPEFTINYFHGCYLESSFEPGAPFNGYSPDRSQHWVDGEVLEAQPPRRLQHTWRSLYDPEASAEPH